MWELWILGYLTVVALLYLGAATLPRLRWVLLTLATLGLVVPLAAIVALLIYLETHPIQIG